MGDVIVTDAKTIPAASDNEILVVEQYPGIPKPTNRLANGIYYSFKKVWYNFSKYFVPNSRTITINGDSKDLSADRSWTIPALVESVADTATIDLDVTSGELTANLKDTTVTAGSYTSADITIDEQGRITAASNGSAGTVTSVAALTLGTTGTDLSSTVANSTTTPVITLNVPTASASNRGALNSTDWSTFNSKEPAITWAQGDLLYGTGVNTYTKLSKDTNATRYLANTGTNNNPVWAQVDLTNGVTGVLPSANGGSSAWVDYSGTTTVTGFSATNFVIVWYQVNYKSITVYFLMGGTSNATTLTFTLPIAHTSNYNGYYVGSISRNNSTGLTTPPGIFISSSSTTVNLYRDISQTAWTNSGDKRCGGTFIYQID